MLGCRRCDNNRLLWYACQVLLPPTPATRTGLLIFTAARTSNSHVIGFTIRNGYARGPKGGDGSILDSSIWRGIPYRGGETAPWQTFPSWQQAVSSNPAIDPCTLPPAVLDANGASGNGYGGGILCNSSSPTISYCVFENCTATGALGGSGVSWPVGSLVLLYLGGLQLGLGKVIINY